MKDFKQNFEAKLEAFLSIEVFGFRLFFWLTLILAAAAGVLFSIFKEVSTWLWRGVGLGLGFALAWSFAESLSPVVN